MADRKRALVFGATGQDGAYVSQKLCARGYEVVGTCRSTVKSDLSALSYLGILQNITLQSLLLQDESRVRGIIRDVLPDLIFNVAGVTSVAGAFDDPARCLTVNGKAVSWMLESQAEYVPEGRFFQASSAQIFGNTDVSPQDETSVLSPENPYADAKILADNYVKQARKSGHFAVCGILYNHESPLRAENFVSRKIVSELVRLKYESGEPLRLGALNSEKDWCFAGDIAEAMILSLEANTADDYVFASGSARKVRDWVITGCEELGLNLIWEGEGINEIGIDCDTGNLLVVIDPRFYRSDDPSRLVGDISKARRVLGWQPQTHFDDLVRVMVHAELKRQHP